MYVSKLWFSFSPAFFPRIYQIPLIAHQLKCSTHWIPISALYNKKSRTYGNTNVTQLYIHQSKAGRIPDGSEFFFNFDLVWMSH